MQIESIIRRKNGTRVTLDSTEYHFTPNAEGAHVADVENDAHIQRFLSVSEGFKIYRTAKVDKQPESVLAGTPATDVPEGIQPALTVDELKAAYKAKFGKAPHHKMSLDAIRQKLAE